MLRKGKLFDNLTLSPHVTLRFLHIPGFIPHPCSRSPWASPDTCVLYLLYCCCPSHTNPPCAHFFMLSLVVPMGSSLCWHLQELLVEDRTWKFSERWSGRRREQKSWTVLFCTVGVAPHALCFSQFPACFLALCPEYLSGLPVGIHSPETRELV